MTTDEAFDEIMRVVHERSMQPDAPLELTLIGGYCTAAIYQARDRWRAEMSQ